MKTTRVPWCRNCDKRIALPSGLCTACANYRAKYHRPRPARLWDKERNFTFCHCGDFAIKAGQCLTCYAYLQRTGRRRPQELADRAVQKCTNCGRPLRFCGYARKSLCPPCHKYRQRTGKPRPRELIERTAPFGWCDECGQPAHRLMTVKVSSTSTLIVRICPQCDDP